MIFFDTSVALKLIIAEPLSPVVRNFVQERRIVVPFSRLIEVEMESALQALFCRGSMTGEQLAGARNLLAQLVREGLFCRIELSLDTIAAETLTLAPLVTSRIGCRTLDLMHVATAKLLGFSKFVSTDKKQIDAAQFCGLQTIDLKADKGGK